MLSIIKKIIPPFLLRFYHLLLAILADIYYRHPSQKIIVIGVTGTSGKSTVCSMLTEIFQGAGYKVGVASTIFFKVAEKQWTNDKKMTMIGRFGLQKILSQMVKANCQYAIIETTSEGIKQFRHVGINYDVIVLTNLYPEHIQSHGSFENYKAAKLKLFKNLNRLSRKLIAGQKIEKTIVVNLDDENSPDFLAQVADVKYGFTVNNSSTNQARVVRAVDIKNVTGGLGFVIDGTQFFVKILGRHNVYNVLAAVCVGMSQGLAPSAMARSLQNLSGIDGRLELIDEGQDFKVIVDYAFEPRAMEKLYQVVLEMKQKNIIHVLGGTGGGRDKARRPVLGEMAAKTADYVIVTNEDPYDEDPQEIINQVADGAIRAGKVDGQNLFKIMDRREAIKKAFMLAGSNDIVLITGKGSERAIVVKNNKKIPWDDRKVAREELKNKQ